MKQNISDKMSSDTSVSTVAQDLKMSRFLILFIISVSMFVAAIGLFYGEKIFEVSTLAGVTVYMMTGLISYGLYVRMYKIQKYPSLYAALSFLSLCLATYLTALDEANGIAFSIGAVIYIILYLTAVTLFNIDDPDAGNGKEY